MESSGGTIYRNLESSHPLVFKSQQAAIFLGWSLIHDLILYFVDVEKCLSRTITLIATFSRASLGRNLIKRH